jgi:hypothetical protein
MMHAGWLDTPEEWNGIPRDEHGKPGVLKAQLNWIITQRGAGKPFLLKHVPMRDKHRLQKQVHNYRREYGKAGFTFAVRQLPGHVKEAAPIRKAYGEGAVGRWTVWTPIEQRAG